MLPLRHVRRWQVASVVLLLAVFIATLMPAVWFWSDRRQLVDWFGHVDKGLHAATFVILAVWFAGLYRVRSYWRIAVGLILFGIVIEACQRLVTYRSAEWFDIVADLTGIVVGLLIAMLGMGGWGLRVENWLTRRRAGARVE